MTHTPGPWIHNPNPEPQNADRHICVNIPSGFARVIAKVKQTDVDNALANARLIAAAPDTLGGCIAALKLLNREYPNSKANQEYVKTLLRAAIAKVEGTP